MIYPDTSILISLILNEARADAVADKIRLMDRPLCISDWTVHELHCALARAVFTRRISEQDFAKAHSEAMDLVADIELGCPLIAVASYQLKNIDALIMVKPNLGLRAADAFHLGILLGAPEMSLLTADTNLHAAALGIDIESILIT
jgi:predicted nucleic acid-binding protein